eukprot:187150-Amphidinium_carterae.1
MFHHNDHSESTNPTRLVLCQLAANNPGSTGHDWHVFQHAYEVLPQREQQVALQPATQAQGQAVQDPEA